MSCGHPTTEMRRDPNTGYNKGCKACRRERAEWLTPEWKEGKRLARRRKRQQCIDAYGGRCACCGEDRFPFLCMDHVDGGGIKQRKSVGGDIYPWLIRAGFPSGFQVLCWNCNAAKHFEGACPHQEGIDERQSDLRAGDAGRVDHAQRRQPEPG